MKAWCQRHPRSRIRDACDRNLLFSSACLTTNNELKSETVKTEEVIDEFIHFDVTAKIAKLSGHWVSKEYEDQEIKEKIALMALLAAKHSIAFMQIWPDAVKEKIMTDVYDAFDIYILGSYNELDELPFMIKCVPKTVKELKANENFDAEQLAQITPDNKHASSEIKDAYMTERHGARHGNDETATLILKEAFVKEYLDEENEKMIKEQEDGGDIIKKRERGDVVIRHTFTAGGITLRDEYLDLLTYPFVEFRYEPGSLYQTPLIERFIPSNKSMDMIVSRIEGWAHTMGVGIWLKRSNE